MKELTYAVIGSGFMGGVLARVGHELPYTRCVGASDIDLERANKLVAEYGGNAYQDFGCMLRQEKPDTVIMKTVPHLHLEQFSTRINPDTPWIMFLE